MQEKAPFVTKAEKLKAEYNKKMEAYNNKEVCSTPQSSPLATPDSACTFLSPGGHADLEEVNAPLSLPPRLMVDVAGLGKEATGRWWQLGKEEGGDGDFVYQDLLRTE